MTIRTLLVSLALALLALFTFLNWRAFNTPTTLSVGVGEVQAPLGLVMLGVTGFVSVLFLIYIVFQQAALMAESRRLAKELKVQRALADEAEASRFVELRGIVQTEARQVQAQFAASVRELSGSVQQLAEQMPERGDEIVRALSAHLGEIEDKLDRALATPASR